MKKEQKPRPYSNRQKKTKKTSPINVQLSKDDLKELLVILKDFMLEEISRRDKMLFLNQSEMSERIRLLEIVENNHRREIHKLKLHCLHDDKLDHIEYCTTSGDFLAAIYKCKRCGKENRRTWVYLSRKEEKALRKLGVKI